MPVDFAPRFNRRAADYSKYRPGYPRQILEILTTEIGFDKSMIVADIGSGTGLLSILFLQNGNPVYGVEPNNEMITLAEQNLSRFPGFTSVKGRAENTGLQNASVDLVVVGQALHWFDPQAATREFARILKENGYVCAVYNDRNKKDAFMQGYEAIILKHEKDRASVPETTDDYLSKFFRGGEYKRFKFPNEQFLDREGLLGRIASASYMPRAGEGERFDRLKEDVFSLFHANEKAGKVRLLYETSVFLGQVQSPA